jgi:hypothetical protein
LLLLLLFKLEEKLMESNLRKQLYEVALSYPDEKIIKAVCGVFMSAVLSKTVGVAYTLRDPQEIPHLCAEIEGAGRLSEMSAHQLAKYVTHEATLERSLGMAAVNSLINDDNEKLQSGDVLGWMQKTFTGAKVGMVGHFPFAPEIKSWAGEFKIVEKQPVEDDLSEEEGGEWLKQCDAVIITGVTILNDTLMDIIEKSPKAWKLMLGPTIPMHRHMLDIGIDAVAGIVCSDTDTYWKSVVEGAIVPRYRGSKPMVLAKEKLDLPNADFRTRIVNDIL